MQKVEMKLVISTSHEWDICTFVAHKRNNETLEIRILAFRKEIDL